MKYTVKYNFKRCQPKWIGDYVRMFGERNEGVEVEAETPEEALESFAKEHRYNKFYLDVVDARGKTLIGCDGNTTSKVAVELTKIAKSLSSAERLEFDIGKGPRSPWGRAQVVYKLANGVNWYDTAGHGGLGVSSAVAHRSLSPQARKLGEQFAGGFWYEEDVACNVAFYERPEWQVQMAAVAGGQVYPKEKMAETIRRYFPSYFEQEFIEKSNKPRFTQRDLKLNDVITINGRPPTFQIVFVPQRFGKLIGRDVVSGRNYAMPKTTFEQRLVKVERDGKVIWSRD